MITVEELSQYRSLIREIEGINKKLMSFQGQTTVSASSHNYPYTQHAVTISGTMPGHQSEIVRLNHRKSDCITLYYKIRLFIYGIEDSLIRQIFEYRYIEGRHRMSWQQVATCIGEADESYPRQKHNRYLSKMKK